MIDGKVNPQDPLHELGLLEPGDVIDLWIEGPRIIKSVLLCTETLDDQTSEWRWSFLDDGSLLEVSEDGYFRYREHNILAQGSAEYEELVAQDGALVRFEERVRAGESARRPVYITLNGKRLRIASTGMVVVKRLGDEPELLPWRSFSSDASENVYFGLAEADDESNVGVGIWTAHVCVSLGRELADADISGIYRKGKPKKK